jgi:prepilin-type processing-associated H-X9-DG protein
VPQPYAVWPTRLLTVMSGNRGVFYCPAARFDAAWDTNANKTLGATGPDGKYDPYGIGVPCRFSLAYNDWGLSLGARPQLGLGGDVNGGFYRGMVTDTMVRRPTEMIMIGDARAYPNPAAVGVWPANLDPTQADQWPSSRHNRRSDLMFCDGHAEAALRKLIIDPANLQWRARWNNDNDPHSEVGNWSVNWVEANRADEW